MGQERSFQRSPRQVCFPSHSDGKRTFRVGSFGPFSDSCSSGKITLFDYLVGEVARKRLVSSTATRLTSRDLSATSLRYFSYSALESGLPSRVQREHDPSQVERPVYHQRASRAPKAFRTSNEAQILTVVSSYIGVHSARQFRKNFGHTLPGRSAKLCLSVLCQQGIVIVDTWRCLAGADDAASQS